MTSSGTFGFSPALSDVVLASYARCGIRRPALTAEHFADAGNEANLLLVEWSNKQPLLWESTTVPLNLIQGTATYTLNANTVMVLVCTIRTGTGTSQNDRVIGPLSTVEYQSIPNKTTQAPPTSFWFNRQIIPQITFWQVPDGGGPYTAMMQVVTQVQDATIPSGTTLNTPYRALDAFTAGLAHRLARIHAPALEAVRKADAADAWNIFAGNDVENVGLYIQPGISAYRA